MNWFDLSYSRPLSNGKAHVAESLNIYPNPAIKYISVSETDNVEFLEMYNIVGNHVLTFNSNNRINISHLKAGVYFVKGISNGESIRLGKFVKQ